MEPVQCGKDGAIMTLVYTCKVRGIDTLHHRCPGCGGRADIQVHNGRVRQVRLTGSPDEFRPDAIRHNEKVQIQPAYTVGGGQSLLGNYQLPVPQGRVDPNQLRAQIMGSGR